MAGEGEGRGRGGEAGGGPGSRPRRLYSLLAQAGAKRSGGCTMDSRTEEYELNGDVHPGSPGSPDPMVRAPPNLALSPCPGAALSRCKP